MIIGISGKIGSGKDTVGHIIQMITYHKYYGNEIEVDWLAKQVNTNALRGGYFNYQIKKFADKLKDIVCLLIGCTRVQLEDRDFKEKELGEEWNKLDKIALMAYNKDNPLCHEKGYLYNTMTPRKMLQLLGTEAGREIIHPNIWVNALMSEYKSSINFSCLLDSYLQEPTKEELESNLPNWIITDMRFPNELQAVKDKGGFTIRINRPETDHLAGDHASETALDNATFDHVITNDGTIEDLIEKVKSILLTEGII